MSPRRFVFIAMLVFATSSALADDSPLRSMGSVEGVEFYVAMNEPQTSCAYGGIKNRTANRLELWWSYVATWSDGHTETLSQHDWLDPGEDKAGWAYYLVCADGHGRISKVRIDNVRVKDLTLEEKVRDAERLASDLERQKKEQDERIAREQKEQEERDLEAKKTRDRLAREEKEQKERDRANDASKKNKKNTQDSSSSGSGGGGGGCDAGCQRQELLARELEKQRVANEANKQLGDTMGNAATQVFLAKGGNEAQAGSTRLFALTFGFGMRLAPVMTDTTGPQIYSFSSQDSGGGLSLAIGFEYWPLFRRWYGLGIVAGAAGGGMFMPGGVLHQLNLEGSARAYLGNRAGWSIAGELGVLRTSLGHSSNLLGSITIGSGSYVATRVGAGPSWCAIEKEGARGQCSLSITGKLLFDATDLANTTRVYQVTLDWNSGFLGRLGFYFELGRGYPAPGSTSHPLDAEDQDRAGTRIAVMMTKGFTWFSGNASR